MDGIVTKPNSVHWKRPSWYRRRTGLERRLLCLSVLLGFVALCLVAVLLNELMTDRKEMLITPEKSTQCNDQVCLTDDCVEAAAGLLVNMNPEADPCTDFYEYSCGGWMKRRVIPEDSDKVTITSELKNRIELNCRGLLESDIEEDEPEALLKAKHLYQACMDEEKISKRGFEPLRAIISKFGGWPLMNDTLYNESAWTLEDILATVYRETGENYFFLTYISVDPHNSDMHIMVIDQPFSLLSREDYQVANFSHRNVVAYREYMETVAMELSLADEDEVRHQVNEILRLEAEIVNRTIPRAERIDIAKQYKRLTVTELQKLVPQFDWLRYFGGIVSPNVNETELLGTFALEYLERLGPVLEATPTRTIANLLMWRLVEASIELLGRKLRKLGDEFSYQVVGEQAEAPRWKSCVKITSESMGSAVSAMFVEKYFDVESKEMTHEMIVGIRKILQETLSETKWMDQPTRAKAVEKLLATREQVGFDDRLKNFTALEEEYKGMNITPDHHFENVFETLKIHVKFSLKKFRQAVNKYRWSTRFQPYKTNAEYQFALNQITFPAGFLQHPFYNRRNPQSMNYGGIGFAISHELLHAFDDRGRLFDKNGNMDEMWTEASIQGFQRETSCLVEQYSNYTVEQIDRKVNGRQTLGENIADNSGLKVAFKAYRKWVERNGAEELPLPGINLTHDQIFFLNFGQLWCSLKRDQSALYHLQTNPHSPGRFRAIGPVTNSPEFSETFQCKRGSPMNPDKKCSVF